MCAAAYLGPKPAPERINGHDKREATLRARLALKGYELHSLSDGGYVVTRWDRSRRLADLDQVAAFAQAAGA